MGALRTLRFLLSLFGFYNPKTDSIPKKLCLTFWFYFINIILTTMSAQCIVELILNENWEIGQMCYVISMSGLYLNWKENLDKVLKFQELFLGQVFNPCTYFLKNRKFCNCLI